MGGTILMIAPFRNILIEIMWISSGHHMLGIISISKAERVDA